MKSCRVITFALNVPTQSSGDAERPDAEGKCEKAEWYYQAALAEGSSSPALLNNTGNHYVICGQPAKAQAYFEKLLQLNPLRPNANPGPECTCLAGLEQLLIPGCPNPPRRKGRHRCP